MKHNTRGFTLLELMIVLAIVALVAFIGVPSFKAFIRSSRLTTSINEFVTALHLARSEAVKRNRDTVIRKIGANWENGWQVFVDVSRANAATKFIFDDDGDSNLCELDEDCLLQVQEALHYSHTLRVKNNSPLTTFVSYTASGMRYVASGASTSSADNSFYLCDVSEGSIPAGGTARVLIVNGPGWPKMALDLNKNGIPEVTSGTDITTCTP